MDKSLNNEYYIRLNKTIDYIHNHYADELNLTRLADVACFSKFHFHRLFRTMVGETLNDFVQRIRLEKSIQKLIKEPSQSITEIALDCGFSSSQNFATLFKASYGLPPSTVRKEYNWDNYKIKMEKLRIKDKNVLQPAEAYLYDVYRNKRQLPIDRIMDQKSIPDVKIVERQPLRVAYVRIIGHYREETIVPAFKKLLQWATPREYLTGKAIVLGVIGSPTSITPEDKLIFDACITVPDSVKADQWVNIQTLPGGKFGVHHCEIERNSAEAMWMNVMLNWLFHSDYQPDDRPLWQIFYNDPETHPLKHQILDLCLPIKPLYE